MKRSSAAALLCALAVLAGCTGAGTEAPEPTAPVLLPQGPGEPAATTTAVPPRQEPPPAAADVDFAAAMVPHHLQALQMAELAPERAQDEGVRTLAARIAAGQGAEVDVLRSWLDERGGVAGAAALQDGHGGHGGHGGDAAEMPGAVTPAQLQQLADARGAEFDELFLQLMIPHHEGALVMAREALVEGTDVRVQELAAEVDATQRVEVERMRELLKGVRA
ncbi:DUF305 domain-containing protein [Kineococcus indalonis]|uniref:DUF305 domain-containing protein n=1 Tax=Kineococcus indalonis TaxID=2696566 RepID=UPI001411E090|nr:DUF305 domain-containing protein [Kineococcus indalonis]NAZ85020.1 DUF305 domain-containing protein [Kineococcus indalonis]